MNASSEALRMVGSAKSKDKTVKVNQQFLANFETVSRHYLLAEHGELELAKKAARADIEAATITYAHLADEIRAGKI